MTDIAEPPPSLKRDSLIIGLISLSHFFSHFFQLSLAPLFPVLHDVFNVSYVMLGSVVAVFYLVSGVCQAFAGIFVDRYGARPALLFGILTMATCVGLAGFVTQFWMFYPLFILSAVGNSVFHPADYSALAHQVSKGRQGRAFSIHSCGGTLGYAAAPAVIVAIAAASDWRTALVAAGLCGWAVAFLVFRAGRKLIPDHGDGSALEPHRTISYRRLIMMPALLFAFGYFLFTSAAGSAFQNFSIVLFTDFHGVPLHAATAALSAYLVFSALGMLLGGVIADHTMHRVGVAAGGLGAAALLMAAVATGQLSFTLVSAAVAAAGLCQGMTTPLRDVLVRGVAPPGATGRVFGFVYSGLDVGSMIGPLIFGMLVDHHAYHATFLGFAALFAMAILSVVTLGRRQIPKPA